MKNWEIVAAALAILGGVWGHLQMFGRWVRGFVVARCWADHEIATVVCSYLTAHARDHAREPSYGTCNRYVNPRRKMMHVAYENLIVTTRLMWRGRAPIWVSKPKTTDHDSSYNFTFAYVRGTLDWSALVLDALEWSANELDDDRGQVRHRVVYHSGRTLGAEIARQRKDNEVNDTSENHVIGWGLGNGRRLLHWKREDIGSPDRTCFTNLALSDELQQLVAEIRLWHESRDWYIEHGLTWRRGYMFAGKPGTGKTSMARAASEDLDLPVHVFDLAGMSNDDLRTEWDKMLEDVPCMALIEDIDAVFHGRTNVASSGGLMSSGGLTFDALLNCLDGIRQNHGVLLVVSTNHLELVDDALADRPGRIDRTVHFEPLDHEGRLKIARRVLGDGDDAWRAAVEHADLSAAQFVEACCRVAIASRFASAKPSEEPYR